MAMLRVCGHPGCGTLTLGELCLEHEQSPAQRADRRRVRAVPALARFARTSGVARRRRRATVGRLGWAASTCAAVFSSSSLRWCSQPPRGARVRAVGQGFSMKLGSTFTITGRTGSVAGKHTRALGKVVLVRTMGSRPVARAHDDDDRQRRGTTGSRSSRAAAGDLTLRIAPPDHHARRYLLHVS